MKMPKLKLYEKGLTPDFVKRAEIELGETPEVRLRSLQQMNSLIKEEPDFQPYTDETFLLTFLRVKKFKVEEAFKMLKKHYTFKARNWGVIAGLKISTPLLEEGYGILLEHSDESGSDVILERFGLVNFDKYTLEELSALALNIYEISIRSEITNIAGYVVIQDYAGLSFKDMMRVWKPSFIRLWITMLQECLPARIKAFHILNAPEYVAIPLRFAKMLVSEKLHKRIHIHGESLESLHKHVSPEILPEEYGGKQGPWTECVKKFNSNILRYESYIDELNKYGYQGKTLKKLRKHSMKSSRRKKTNT